MNTPLLLIVAIISADAAAEHLCKGRAEGFMVWLSYACANIALIWYVK